MLKRPRNRGQSPPICQQLWAWPCRQWSYRALPASFPTSTQESQRLWLDESYYDNPSCGKRGAGFSLPYESSQTFHKFVKERPTPGDYYTVVCDREEKISNFFFSITTNRVKK